MQRAEMTAETFEFLSSLIRQRGGLVLAREQGYLLESRLLPLARKRSIPTLEALVEVIRAKRDEILMRDVTDAMTTNDTQFFRDQFPFDNFRNSMIPRFIANNASTKRIRIWSAGTSSGQEAYSLAMLCIEEAMRLNDWKIDIVATDLSDSMLRRGQRAIYSQFEVQRGLPVAYLVKYFRPVEDGWQLNPDMREMIRFKNANLLQDDPTLGTFDVIFCRYVLPYFDAPTKTRVMELIAPRLVDNGVLVLGKNESLNNISDLFKPMDGVPGFFVPNRARK